MSKSKRKSTLVGAKIGIYVRYQRKKQKRTLNDLAASAKLTPSFLLRLEKGDYESVGFDVIEKLACGLSMSVEDFLYKCEIITLGRQLPQIDYYLKELYQLPPRGIEDIKLYIEFIVSKYSTEIAKRKKQHETYWKTKKN